MSWESILKVKQGPRKEMWMDEGPVIDESSMGEKDLPIEYWQEKAGRMQNRFANITYLFGELKRAQKGKSNQKPEFYMEKLEEDLKKIFDVIQEMEDYVERRKKGNFGFSTTFSGYRPFEVSGEPSDSGW